MTRRAFKAVRSMTRKIVAKWFEVEGSGLREGGGGVTGVVAARFGGMRLVCGARFQAKVERSAGSGPPGPIFGKCGF